MTDNGVQGEGYNPILSEDERIEELTHLIVSSKRAMHTNESGGAERELARRIVRSGYRQIGGVPSDANMIAMPVKVADMGFVITGYADGTLNITCGIDPHEMAHALEFIAASIHDGSINTPPTDD